MNKKRIFLAEDDVDDQDIFREIVTDMNEDIQLRIAENGEKLLELMENLDDHELPHLLVLDQNMPLLKGSETIHVLRANERYKDIPAVIYSTYHDSKFIEDCRALQIELLLKPNTFDDLSGMINNLVNRYIYLNNPA